MNSEHISKNLGRLAWITFAAFVICSGFILFGFPRGYETSAYHLPLALHFLRHQTLLPWDQAFMHTYPANASIIYALLLSLFNERLVSEANVCFLPILVYIVYQTTHALGASKDWALLFCLGLSTIPLVMFSSLELGADIQALTFLALAWFFIIRQMDSPTSDRNAQHRLIFFSGLASGIALGFKLVHLPAVIGILIVSIFHSHSRARTLCIFICGLSITFSYWALRNYIVFHNPVYPVYLPFFSLLGFSSAPDVNYLFRNETQYEWVRAPIEWLFYPWLEWHRSNQNFKHSSGLGPFIATFLVPGFVATVILRIKRLRSAQPAILWSLFVSCLVLLGWWIGGDRQPRYFLGFFIFSFPVAASIFSQMNMPQSRILFRLGSACVLMMLFVLVTKQGIELGDILLSKAYERHAFYGYPETVDRLPQDSTILNLTSRPMNYGLFGKDLKNNVISSRAAALNFASMPMLLGVDDPVQYLKLPLSEIRSAKITHILAVEGTRFLELDPCITLQEMDAKRVNPLNGIPLSMPLVLYQVSLCSEGLGLEGSGTNS